MGDFTITSNTMNRIQMVNFYRQGIGRRIVEKTAGITTWDGEIVDMVLVLEGQSYHITLDPERWHNKVKTKYGYSETAFSEDTDSSDVYGESGYIDYIGGAYDSTSATAKRDKRLADNAFPRSRPQGGSGGGLAVQTGGNTLHVMCAGYVFSMNRRYQTSDIAAGNLSAQISTLVGNSEFVTAGTIETNTLSVPVSVTGVEVRLWDLISELVEMGDASGNLYVGGVYEDQKFHYEAAETVVTHYWRKGRLLNRGFSQVLPTMIRPDIIVQFENSPGEFIPPGGAARDDPRSVYIEEVEFIAPNSYRLIPTGGL
jgi:hypothetical protein